jgi:hypothetical protein
MSLKLHELTTDAEFGPVVAVETEAFNDPFFGFWQVFYGGTSPEEFCARQASWHKDDPSSNWIYVTDEETGSVIGGAQWNIYKENPYAKETAMLTPYWIPEGILKCVSCNGPFRLTFHYGRYPQRHRRSASPWFPELPPHADERTPYM